MCGIFGIISQNTANEEDYKILAKLAQQRGKDSSGIIKIDKNHYSVIRSDSSILDLIGKLDLSNSSLLLGHSRLITNGHSDNQPVSKGEVILLHNGIIVNDSEIWNSIDAKREQRIDSEVIAGIASDFLEINEDIQSLPKKILKDCKGVVSCALLIPKLGKLLLFSNNGSLYLGKKGGDTYFSSEKFPLTSVKST